MKFGSMCSGIEAASVAWGPLGWEAEWFSEIDPYACALLAHHYPKVPNHGDMLGLVGKLEQGEIEAPDVVCGGTPCQAFSLAGKRGSLDDERGNLTLVFCEVVDATDAVRKRNGKPECIVFWENVPGILNTKDNAFGCFLAKVAGESIPLQPAGGRWPDAGCVYGPRRAVAWRILDAQYFGLAQRRKRVFVIASARDGFDPAAVLFEFEGLRRDSAPSREAGENLTYDVAPSLTASGRGVERIDESRGQDPIVAQPVLGCWWDGGQLSQTLDAVLYKGQTMPEKNRFPAVLQPIGFDPISRQPEIGNHVNISPPVKVGGSSSGVPPAICFKPSHYTRSKDGAPSEIHPPLTAEGKKGDQESLVAVAIHENQRAEITLSETAGAIICGSGKPGQGYPAVACFKQGQGSKAGGIGYSEHLAPTLQASQSGTQLAPALLQEMMVRRLMPVECERLQGFADEYTYVPYRGKASKDGPRYKAIGNSWPVNVVFWLGARIDYYVKFMEGRA